MAVADPKCPRCDSATVWIGIGPGAEAVCRRECEGKCPRCLSSNIEPFAHWSYWGPVPNSNHRSMHCNPCGAVWDDPEKP